MTPGGTLDGLGGPTLLLGVGRGRVHDEGQVRPRGVSPGVEQV